MRAGQLNNGQVPFHEPGLPEMLTATLSTGQLRFTDRPAEALTDADFVFLCVGTPPGAGRVAGPHTTGDRDPILGAVSAR